MKFYLIFFQRNKVFDFLMRSEKIDQDLFNEAEEHYFKLLIIFSSNNLLKI